MGPTILLAILCAATLSASAQQQAQPAQPAGPQSATSAQVDPVPEVSKPLPDIRELLLDVERNQKALEAARRSYTYHVHTEEQELDKHGNLKKTEVTDAQSVRIDGVLINRVLARNGKPLTPEETQKESDRIDKEVAKDKARRTRREEQGQGH